MHSNYVSFAIYFYIIADNCLKIQLYCKFMVVYKTNVHRTEYKFLSYHILYWIVRRQETFPLLFGGRQDFPLPVANNRGTHEHNPCKTYTGGFLMQSFEFKMPTEIIFGHHAEDRVAEKLRAYGASRVYIVYGGGSVVRSGLLSRIERQLTSGGLAFQVLGGVQPNPRVALVREGIREALAFKANFILAVGGGSVIDSAKAIAHGVANPGTDIWDFWSGRAKLEKTTPVGSVLTLAAAGSETSDSAVLTNEDTMRKVGLNTPLNRPVLAFMNPELTFTVPEKQLVCGVSDIIMHTLERYFTKVKEANVFTDRVAEDLIKTVMDASKAAVKDRENYDAMSEIMWCGSVSHSNFTELGRGKDFSVHKLGHELSARFDATHGASLTSLWGSWAQYVYQDDTARFAQFAERIFGIEASAGTEEERARQGIEKMVAYFKSLGMPVSLPELLGTKLNDSELYSLADLATAGDTKKLGTFHPLNRKDVLAIYKLANK